VNFQVLQHQLSQIKELAVIGRNAEMEGVICHVMGMVRRDDHTLQMLILQYDGAYREKLEAVEIADLTDPPVGLITNCIEQRGDRNLDEPTGKLGLQLKAANIQEPMAANTINIEAELFQYYQMGKADDSVIV